MPSSRSRSRSANRKPSNSSDRQAANDARQPSPSSSSSSHFHSNPKPAPPANNSPEKNVPVPSNPRRDQDRPAPNAKLFVTNIDSKYTEQQLNRELKGVFEPFGAIKEIVIKTKQGSNNSYCFVEYQALESAIKAEAGLRGYSYKGKELKVEFGRGERKAEDRRSDKCYICHKEGHFAKDCKYNRYSGSDDRRDRYDDRGRERDRDDRDYRDRDSRRDRDYRDRDRDRDRDYDRDRRDHRHRSSRYDSRSSSSSSRSHRKRHYDRDRDDYRRRDTRRSRSPQRRSGYSSKRY